jgi:hypothetical protein
MSTIGDESRGKFQMLRLARVGLVLTISLNGTRNGRPSVLETRSTIGGFRAVLPYLPLAMMLSTISTAVPLPFLWEDIPG